MSYSDYALNDLHQKDEEIRKLKSQVASYRKTLEQIQIIANFVSCAGDEALRDNFGPAREKLEIAAQLSDEALSKPQWYLWHNQLLKPSGSRRHPVFDKKPSDWDIAYHADVQARLHLYTCEYLEAFRIFYAPVYGVRQVYISDRLEHEVYNKKAPWHLNSPMPRIFYYLMRQSREDEYTFHKYANIFEMPQNELLELCLDVQEKLPSPLKQELITHIDSYADKIKMGNNILGENFICLVMLDLAHTRPLQNFDSLRCPWRDSPYLPHPVSAFMPLSEDECLDNMFTDKARIAQGWREAAEKFKEAVITQENCERHLYQLLGDRLADRFMDAIQLRPYFMSNQKKLVSFFYPEEKVGYTDAYLKMIEKKRPDWNDPDSKNLYLKPHELPSTWPMLKAPEKEEQPVATPEVPMAEKKSVEKDVDAGERLT